MQETGENLPEQAFEPVTDEQLGAFSRKTGQQRMDRTRLASNIRQMGRVQRLVTVLQRVWRMLSEEDQPRYADLFAPYLKGHAGQYVYRLKKEDLPIHLQRIGEEMRRLLTELEAVYGDPPTYHVLARVFAEHFRLEPEGLQVKEAGERSASNLPSPDDLEATYREKRGQGHRGYVVNLAETCDPENPVQWITQVQVAPNTTDDSALLAEALPDLKARPGVDTVFTDGSYGSPKNDALLAEHQVTLIQTAIRGRPQDPERFYREDFRVQADASGQPEQVTCPKWGVGPGERLSFGRGLSGGLWASLRHLCRAGLLPGGPAETVGSVGLALHDRSVAAGGASASVPPASGEWAEPAGGGGIHGARCETSLCGRESPGAGPLPGDLYGHWVSGGGQCRAVAPLLAGQRAATAGEKGAGGRAEAAARTGGTAGVFFCVFFRQGDSGAAMAIPGPPAVSTPGIGLVKFGLFAEDS
ncbi:hypothetical protein SAMN02746019_00018510 [Thermoflexus hugenholtzii JAD2]|uniref:Transposase DDE domain-containing protein n=1 Tax=Thermoflexus hugenholtzii JAD2 TaxID=877466 RepID=A0A212RRE4_9CHLR|nr:hypothetical protein [Thermoflexus hugenholtzii]SNB75062.1 hypothetical protein SAMN02746019_00018510 [Thermoflexus hugenholtzii JAD2]